MISEASNMINELFLKYKQFFKFCVVGVLNTLISWLAYYILLKLKMFYLIANCISFFIGMLNGFVCNKKWVFSIKGYTKKTFIKYTSVNLSTLLISTILLFLFVNTFGLSKVIAQILVTALILFISYFGNKLWTFKSPRQ